MLSDSASERDEDDLAGAAMRWLSREQLLPVHAAAALVAE